MQVVLWAVLLAAPLLLKGFVTFQLTMILIYGLSILSLNLLTGASGQVSLGHSAFFAIGAYVAAILMEHGGLAYPLTLPIAGAACFVLGFAFGLPALRLSGVYLALATFSLALAMPQLLKVKAIEQWKESGKAPDQLIVNRYKNGMEVGKRLVCPYPQIAKYKGTGSMDEAASFECRVR